MIFKLPTQYKDFTIDTLLVSVIKSDINRFKNIFIKDDFLTPGGKALVPLLKRGQPLAALGILIPQDEIRREAELIVAKANEVKVDPILISILLKRVPVVRELNKALLAGLEVDIPKLARNLKNLHHAEMGEAIKPKPGEWIDLIAKAHASKSLATATGIATLDLDLEGGLWEGEVGFIMAPSFRGKTWMMVQLGSTAAQAGVPVLHLTPEIVDHRVFIRYAQNTLGLSRSKVLGYAKSTLQRKLSRVWKAPLRITSIRGAKRQMAGIQDEIYNFPKGSLILLDASELLSLDGGSEGWQAAGTMIVDLRDTVEELGMSMWTTVQTNRGGMNRDAGMENIAESIRKVWAADVIIAMQQSSGDLSMNKMRLQILKARERESGTSEISLIGDASTQRFLEIEEEEDDGTFKISN